MVDAAIEHELSAFLAQLPVEQQRQVLDFARMLATSSPRGVNGLSLSKFAGTIDESDLDVMSQAIAQGCERIDTDEW